MIVVSGTTEIHVCCPQQSTEKKTRQKNRHRELQLQNTAKEFRSKKKREDSRKWSDFIQMGHGERQRHEFPLSKNLISFLLLLFRTGFYGKVSISIYTFN